jgi:cell division protein FtsI/penicillin-binding protein 2
VAARAIGQDAVRATPLGVAGLVCMVATDGQIPRPRLDPDQEPSRTRVLPAADASTLRSALADVVVRGTAARAFADHPWRSLMIGKTGSAQRIDANGLPRTDSWFAGAVLPPSDLAGSPVVVVVVMPGAGLGGRHAAEVADHVSRAVIVARGWDRSEVVAARW